MSQSDGKNILKKIEFAYGKKSYKFILNPEEYVQSEPSRTTVTQTRGGAYLDAWGAGLPTFEIKGTTGFKNGLKKANSGFNKFVELRNFIREIYDDVVPGTKAEKLLKFYNYTDDDYWYVYPLKFILTRNKSRPLLYNYDIVLQGLAKIGDYDPTEINTGKTNDKDLNPETPNSIVKDHIEAIADDSASNGEDTSESEEGSEFNFSKMIDVELWMAKEFAKNTSLMAPIIRVTDAVDDLLGSDEKKENYILKKQSRMFRMGLKQNNIVEASAELQTGVNYDFNIEVDEYVINSMKTLLDNFRQLLGGTSGRVSPFMAKYVTSDFNILATGKVSNIFCDFLLDDGFKDIGYINYISMTDNEVYQKLLNFDESIIEVDLYYRFINDYLYLDETKNKNISYKTIISVLLSKGYEILDSYIVRTVASIRMPLSYTLMFKSIILSSINIYNKINTFLVTEEKISYSLHDLDILINNIKYFSRLLENYEPNLRPLKLIEMIRRLQINVINFRGTQALFDNCARDVY